LKMTSRKDLSPLIRTLLLILIVIAVSILAYTWITTYHEVSLRVEGLRGDHLAVLNDVLKVCVEVHSLPLKGPLVVEVHNEEGLFGVYPINVTSNKTCFYIKVNLIGSWHVDLHYNGKKVDTVGFVVRATEGEVKAELELWNQMMINRIIAIISLICSIGKPIASIIKRKLKSRPKMKHNTQDNTEKREK